MTNLQYSKILKKNWEIVALIMGVTIVLALIISLLQPFQYSASTKMLIIQKQDKNLDAYTATKSAERIGKNLANIIFTSSFYNEVIDENEMIKSKVPQDSVERKKIWQKNVKANVIPETGILQISVYDVDRNYASQLVKNITYVLVNRGSEYHGGGADVSIKIVDDVLISKYPVRPNIILNSALALVLGFLLASAFIILSEARKLNKIKEASVSKQASLFGELKKSGVANYSDEEDEDNDNEEYFDLDNEPIQVLPSELEPEEIVSNQARQTDIKTMYDHLK